VSDLPRAAASEARPRLLERLALHRPELRAWAMYDWANSVFITIVVTAVFPIYFAQVAVQNVPAVVATQRFGIATTTGLAIIAVFSPILGAIADFSGSKKRFLGGFLGLGVLASACLFFVQHGDWRLATVLFVLGNIGAAGSFVFYDSLLPHIARDEEIDRVSTAGYALGYLGGGLLLAANVLWLLKPQWFGLPSGPDLTPSEATLPTRIGFVAVALWWALFSIPLFRRVPEPPRALEADERARQNPVRVGFVRLVETLRELRAYKPAFLMLVAFLVYNDGIQTIIRMAAIYGSELQIDRSALILAILLVQFVGIPFAFLFGALAGPFGTRRMIFVGLVVYAGISVFGYFIQTATHFFLLAILVGIVQGGTQALSRSLFASLIPRYKSAEFFGFFAVGEKFAGIMGPAIFTLAAALTGSSRNAVVAVVLFFIVGGVLLSRVDVEQGKRIARAAQEAVRVVREGETSRP
jgi:UMF1 family MFS transporter